MSVIQRELAKLGVDFQDDREVIPESELPEIAKRLGITFYGPGSKYLLPAGTKVVAITHDEGFDVDAVVYGTIDELQSENIVGLFVK